MRILICDDSGMARKQAARSLPSGFAEHIVFAEHGAMALEVFAAETIDLLLLDLTMPVLDGFETLAAMRERQIECGVIVISGDIQPRAREKVMALGALDFIQKPIDADKLQKTLRDYGFIGAEEPMAKAQASAPSVSQPLQQEAPTAVAASRQDQDIAVSPLDSLREVSNIAMGDAAAKLAKLLGTFIQLPIPNVAWLTPAELEMALGVFQLGGQTVVSQGFVSRGMAGEAILYADRDGVTGLRRLMAELRSQAESNNAPILDAASVLIGAFLSRFGKEVDLSFSKSQPVMLAQNIMGSEYIYNSAIDDVLMVEIPYVFSERGFGCDLMILMPKVSGEHILERVGLLLDEELN
ncbi:response regulator [Simiduia curdlanivorans]|uniref:Response regulator n=1 Tax=Simiduia curdlanivorans TaxID=1492769 RepID=A0ABV8V4P0_9GAMM|nr:response regulator [Simiduia curdlanivorans]MDN3640517.1 response regulator [Simiduia curdlanivorans]